jgi:hypothetical protein
LIGLILFLVLFSRRRAAPTHSPPISIDESSDESWWRVSQAHDDEEEGMKRFW